MVASWASRGLISQDNALKVAVKAQLDLRGYAALPRHDVTADARSVATKLGEPMDPWNEGIVQKLTPRASSTPNTYSGIFGLGQFPFHSDLAHWDQPPRYVLLRCVTGYLDVPTLLVDGRAIVSLLTPDLLSRAIVRPRRRNAGRVRLLRLLRLDDQGGSLFRWDEIFLKPASSVGKVACDLMRTCLKTAVVVSVPMVNTGDTVIIDNWRMLHSRSEVPEGREDRHLERVYLRRLH